MLSKHDEEDVDGPSTGASTGASTGTGASERLLISETLACVVVIVPSALRQYVLEGPVPTLPKHLSASASSSSTTTAVTGEIKTTD